MDLPDSILVGPHRYQIQLVPGGALGDAGQVGHCTPSRLSIAVCSDQKPTQLADTILHELTHAILTTGGLEPEVEERVALLMGPGLLQILRDNPTLVAYITGVK